MGEFHLSQPKQTMNGKPIYNPNIHHRRSIRLKGYDYSQAGLYFITICCQNRAFLFGEITNGKMVLNNAGKIANDEWLNTPKIRPNVELGEFIIMPNHIHGIIRILDRGELHSPENDGNNNGDKELHSPEHDRNKNGDDELHSPENDGNNNGDKELHSPENDGNNNVYSELHSTENDRNKNGDDELHSPENDSNNNGDDELHSHKIVNVHKGECNSPPQGPSNTIGAIIRGYKSSVTKQLNLMNIGRAVWQRNYHEHIIRNEQSYQNISNYIIHNPTKWMEKFEP